MTISSDICATHKNIETVTMVTIIRIMTKSQKLGHLLTHCHHFKYMELPIAIIIILIIKFIILDNYDDIFSCLDDLTSTCPALEGEVIKKTKKLLVRFLMTTE